MPLEVDEAPIHRATELIAEQKHAAADVKALLAKIKNGYFSGKDVVLHSGLSKADVKKIIDAYDHTEPKVRQVSDLQAEYEAAVQRAFLAKKKVLEDQLLHLKAEKDTAVAKFPRGNASLLGNAPAGDLKKAYAEMH